MMMKSKGVKKESSTKDSWSMSGDFFFQHHDEPRLKLYDPVNETFPILCKYVDVMRQCQTKKKKAISLEQILNGFNDRGERCQSF